MNYNLFRLSRWQLLCYPLLAAIMVLFMAGCQPGFKSSIRPIGEVGREAPATPRLSFLLNLNNPDGPGVILQLASIEILAGTEWLPVVTSPAKLDSLEIGGRQAVPWQPKCPSRFL